MIDRIRDWWCSRRLTRQTFTPRQQARIEAVMPLLWHAGIDGDDHECARLVATLTRREHLHLLWIIAPLIGDQALTIAGGDRQRAHDHVTAGQLDHQLDDDPRGHYCPECWAIEHPNEHTESDNDGDDQGE